MGVRRQKIADARPASPTRHHRRRCSRTAHLTAPGPRCNSPRSNARWGLTLTERHGRTLTLTPAGNDIVDLLSVAELEMIASRGGSAGTYRVAAFPSIARTGLADFSGHDWVVPHAAWSCHEMVQRACGVAGFAPRSVAEATDFSVILALVGAGVGVALVPELTVGQLPDSVTLHPLENPVYRLDFVVVRQSLNADPGIGRLRDLFATRAGRVAMRGIPTNSVTQE
ncbi:MULTISPECIES: LysR substrate-binding domain-containing protein [unclassified Cryobacterium]|uniref:LysR substrate-binding domain-containing protein n=1 Tax=unclassified Cryobacterium TaxID=2649013 RepID=UPI000CE453A5|nr:MULTISPECIES: LysR substrate-binding domain-containing protein [unclassified Cryobacterium]